MVGGFETLNPRDQEVPTPFDIQEFHDPGSVFGIPDSDMAYYETGYEGDGEESQEPHMIVFRVREKADKNEFT